MNIIVTKEWRLVTRQRSFYSLRVLYVALLVVTLWLVHQEWSPPLSWGPYPEFNARVSLHRHLVRSYTTVQFVFLLVSAPLIGAWSWRYESWRGTQALLLLSQLDARQIIRGKFWAHTSLLVFLLLHALPLMFCFFPLGGISIWQLALIILIQSGVAALGVSIGISSASRARSWRTILLQILLTYAKQILEALLLAAIVIWGLDGTYALANGSIPFLILLVLMGFLASALIRIGQRWAATIFWLLLGGLLGLHLLRQGWGGHSWWYLSFVHPCIAGWAVLSVVRGPWCWLPGLLAAMLSWYQALYLLRHCDLNNMAEFTRSNPAPHLASGKTLAVGDRPLCWAEQRRLWWLAGEWNWLAGLASLAMSQLWAPAYQVYLAFLAYVFFLMVGLVGAVAFASEQKTGLLDLLLLSPLGHKVLIQQKLRGFFLAVRPLLLWILLPALLLACWQSPAVTLCNLMLGSATAAFLYFANLWLAQHHPRTLVLLLGTAFWGVCWALHILWWCPDQPPSFWWQLLNPVYTIAWGSCATKLVSALFWTTGAYACYRLTLQALPHHRR